NETQYTSRKKQVDDNENAVKNIISGQDERLDWVLLNRFINDCLPVPALRVEGKFQGSKDEDEFKIVDRSGKSHSFKMSAGALLVVDGKYVLPKDVKEGADVAVVYQEYKEEVLKKYWTNEAKLAYLKYWERQGSGKGLDQAEDKSVGNLIQVNLEGVYALYSTDLKAFFS